MERTDGGLISWASCANAHWAHKHAQSRSLKNVPCGQKSEERVKEKGERKRKRERREEENVELNQFGMT